MWGKFLLHRRDPILSENLCSYEGVQADRIFWAPFGKNYDMVV